MRINLYDHEVPFMAERAEHVRKVADTGIAFHGFRMYTEEPFMHQPNDDDSGAVTVWVPWTKKGGHDVTLLREIIANMIHFCNEVDRIEALSQTITVTEGIPSGEQFRDDTPAT